MTKQYGKTCNIQFEHQEREMKNNKMTAVRTNNGTWRYATHRTEGYKFQNSHGKVKAEMFYFNFVIHQSDYVKRS